MPLLPPSSLPPLIVPKRINTTLQSLQVPVQKPDFAAPLSPPPTPISKKRVKKEVEEDAKVEPKNVTRRRRGKVEVKEEEVERDEEGDGKSKRKKRRKRVEVKEEVGDIVVDDW